MKTFTYTIKDELGIHARPAGLLVKEAQKFPCVVKLTKGANGKTADCKKLFALMGLGVKCGDEVTVACDGENETECAEAIEKFLNNNL